MTWFFWVDGVVSFAVLWLLWGYGITTEDLDEDWFLFPGEKWYQNLRAWAENPVRMIVIVAFIVWFVVHDKVLKRAM